MSPLVDALRDLILPTDATQRDDPDSHTATHNRAINRAIRVVRAHEEANHG